MTRLVLALLVLGGLLLFCVWQFIRGLRTGALLAFTGGKQSMRTFVCRRAESPLVFWHTMVWYAAVPCGLYWILATQIIGPYAWGEVAPQITVVQPSDRYDMQLYWDAPERFVDPTEYIVYRLDDSSGELERIGTAYGGSGVGQHIDQNVEAGTNYTYRVEAVYDAFTMWVIGSRNRISEPMSGKSSTW